LANWTESRVGADLSGYFAVARNGTIMKMGDADAGRDKYQRRAQNRDRARRYATASVEPRYHDIAGFDSLIEPAAQQPDVSSARQSWYEYSR